MEEKVFSKTSMPMIRLKEFWEELEKKTEVKINDFEKLSTLFGQVLDRCDQFVMEARKSRDEWRRKYQELKTLKSEATN